MADLRISSLPRKSALASTDLIPIVDLQFGAPNYVNKKTTIGDLITIIAGSIGSISGVVTSVNGQTGAVTVHLADLDDVNIQFPADGEVLRYDGELNKWVNTTIDTNNGAITTTFTVKAVTQGAYSDGDEITAGTPLETVIKNMLQAVVPAVYVSPTLAISATPATYTYEYGATVTVYFALTWAKNDAGNASSFRIFKDGNLAHTVNDTDPGAAYSNTFNLTTVVTFNAAVDYATGEQKTDNMGNPSGLPIASGTLTSNTLTFTPRHKRYWGVSAATALSNSDILALTGAELNTTRAQSRVFNTNAQYIYFAWPSSFGDASFTVNGLPNSAWTKTTLSFTNSSGYVEPYTVYRSQYLSTGNGISIQVS